MPGEPGGERCDLLISAAAISDYTLDHASNKIGSGAQLTLELAPGVGVNRGGAGRIS